MEQIHSSSSLPLTKSCLEWVQVVETGSSVSDSSEGSTSESESDCLGSKLKS